MRRIVLWSAWIIVAIAADLWAAAPRGHAPAYVEGEVIVTFRKSVQIEKGDGALAARSLAMTKPFDWLSEQRGRRTGLVRSPGKSTAALIAALKDDPSVESVEPNYLRWTCGGMRFNDPRFTALWGLQNTGQTVAGTAGTSGDDIEFADGWSLAGSSSRPPIVAVVDTGVDYTHPDLAASMWTNTAEIAGNGLDDDGNGYADDVCGYDFANVTSDPMDVGDHGTHVAGIIAAAGNNGVGTVGVAFRSQVAALKVSTDGTSIASDAAIEAIEYAAMMRERGVNIVAINASYGGAGYADAERAAIEAAGNAGIVFCTAAGNDASDNDASPFYPASYGLSNMIVVAASDQNDALADFSNHGATSVDLCAPGVNILSALPTALGTNAVVVRGPKTYAGHSFSYGGLTDGISGSLYDCGLGYATNFPAAVSGNVALIKRGTLYFSEKVANAMAAGARAAIIYNNVAGDFLGSLQYASNWIPAVSISQADGTSLVKALPTTVTVVNADGCYQLLDGTSMATPHVAGAVAFAAMNDPADSVTQRIQRILAAAEPVAGLSGKVKTGGRLNLRRMADTDADSLPDWWERTYFLSLAPVAGADPDDDGAGNLAEWLAGTVPTNGNSCLRLTQIVLQGTNGVALCWQSVSGKHYRVEAATNLASGFTGVIRTNVPALPPTNTETDPTGAWERRFYRLSLQE